MPAAIPILASMLMTLGGVGPITSAIVVGGASLLAGAMSYAMQPSAVSEPEAAAAESRGHLVNTRSSNVVKPLIYGLCRVGVNQTFMGVTGDKNQYIHIIGEIGEGPIHQIHQEGGIDQFFLGDKLYTEYGDLVYYEFFQGTSTQTVCTGKPGVGMPAEWDHALRYTSYIYVCLEWDPDVFQRLPAFTLVLEGLEVYDPVADFAAYSNNPALCTYDYLTRPKQRGGFGIDTWYGPVPVSPDLDINSFDDGKDYCATKGWTVNMPLRADVNTDAHLDALLANFRGQIIDSDGLHKLRYADLNYEAVVMTLDEDDIVSGAHESTLKIAPRADIIDRPNAVRASFYNPEKKYTLDEYLYVDETALAAEGFLVEMKVNLHGLSSHATVQPMAWHLLERARWGNVATLIARPKAKQLEAMDLIQVTHRLPGWTNQMARVLASTVQTDHNVALVLIEESSYLYDDNYDAMSHDWYETTLPDPSAAVPNVVNVSQSEELYDERKRSRVRWIVDFEGPDPADYPWWSHAEIYLKIGEAGDWKYQTTSQGGYMVDPVQEGETYFLKMRSVSIYGTKEDINAAYSVSKTIQGKTAAPSDMTTLTAVVVNDSVNVVGDEVSDADIFGYEFRLSGQGNSAWEGAFFLEVNSKPTFSRSGMRSGSFRIFCSPLDTSGYYSDNPVSQTFSLDDPKGYSLLQTEDIDQDDAGDSFDNCEMYDQGAGDYALRVTHGGGLAGTYTSREIDLGAVRAVRVQGDFLLTMISASATWAALWPADNAWNTRDMSKPWSFHYGLTEAANISATLKWGTSSGVYPNEADLFHLLAVESLGRYFQVEITITDPNEDTYLYVDGSAGDTVLTLSFYV